MSRIRNEEWLHLAKGTPIGSQRRVVHGSEHSAAMTVGNREDRWWAYCQRCKQGAVEMKAHVLLTGSAPPKSADLSLPQDALPIHMLPVYQQQHIAGFLARKHMDLSYLTSTTPTWSAERQRLLLYTPSGVMGRDTSERSPQKWLTYNRQHWITDLLDSTRPYVLLTEDCFSWAKVQYALSINGINTVSTFCTLGTSIHDSLFLHLLQHNKRVFSFYDGDSAGWSGALRNEQRLLAVGLSGKVSKFQMCAPPGKDPKDLDIAEIVQRVLTIL